MKHIGIYNPYLETRGGGEKVCLALAEALSKLPDCKVSLLAHDDVDVLDLGKYFALDLGRVQFINMHINTFMGKLLHRLPVPGRVRNLYFDFKASRSIKKHNFDLFINNCVHSNLPNPCKKGVYMCMFPQALDAKHGGGVLKSVYIAIMNVVSRMLLHPGKKNAILTYDLVTANSAYTQGYVRKLWGMDSTILYPICENMHEKKAAAKQKIIFSVGRFFENSGENHHKRHDMLVNTFAGLTDLHKQGWELHLAGTVAEDVGGLKYILKLMKDAQGLPVYFHFSCSFGEIKRLFNEATVYWHATGFGSSVDEHPEKQEHFGITTVESMSAGCIPIVINSAGQKESVAHAHNGFLWDTKKELASYTRKVATMTPAERKKLSTQAVHTATRFDANAFGKQVQTIFGPLLG